MGQQGFQRPVSELEKWLTLVMLWFVITVFGIAAVMSIQELSRAMELMRSTR